MPVNFSIGDGKLADLGGLNTQLTRLAKADSSGSVRDPDLWQKNKEQ